MTSPGDLVLADRVDVVRSGIVDAAREAGRSPDEITTIVVTKFHPESLVRELHRLGVRDFGENRHQEAAVKAQATRDLPLVWHFVGQLQGNKAKRVREYAQVIHSVDRESLVDALMSETVAVDCFLQINLTEDAHRGGTAGDAVLRLAEKVLSTAGLNLLGVMAVAPLGEDPRHAFSRVAAISLRVQSVAPEAAFISAGMSADYREAILEGATHLRIGTAITGKRPDAG
ncbi:MAG: YggS family pyridoxal phosphate-dependent enzyme [Terrimesophilobacter sp.]